MSASEGQPPNYSALLEASGKLKLKATSLMAYGDDESRFDAAVLFHDAARLEARALALLPDPPPRVRLASAIERCGCLLEGLDVVQAIHAWQEVEQQSRAVPREEAEALRARIDPLYHAMQRDRAEATSKAPVLTAANFVWSDVPEADRSRVAGEISAVLSRFPGDAVAYFISAMAALHDQRLDDAARAIQRASRLRPDDPFFRGLALLLLPITMDATELEKRLAQTYDDLRREPADGMVYLGFVVASLGAFFAGARPAVQKDRALWAAGEGATRPSKIQGVKRFFALAPVLELIMDDPERLEPILREVLRSLGVEDRAGPEHAPTHRRLLGAVISGVVTALPPPPQMPLAA